MDDQGVIERASRKRRISGAFVRIPPAELDMFDLEWLKQIEGVGKVDYRAMLDAIDREEWDLWKLPDGVAGIAVTYPENGLLFIYYLHGRGLFGRLSPEDLLEAARAEGLSGVAAHVVKTGMKRTLERLGFVHIGMNGNHYVMELKDA